MGTELRDHIIVFAFEFTFPCISILVVILFEIAYLSITLCLFIHISYCSSLSYHLILRLCLFSLVCYILAHCISYHIARIYLVYQCVLL